MTEREDLITTCILYALGLACVWLLIMARVI